MSNIIDDIIPMIVNSVCSVYNFIFYITAVFFK